MRKILFFCFLAVSFNGYSQFVGWEPVRTPPVNTDLFKTPPVPMYTPPREVYISAPQPKASITKSKLIDVETFDFSSESVLKAKIKILNYSDGNTKIYFIGKKIYDEWKPVKDVELLSISYLLSISNSNDEKSTLLELSEDFTHIAIDENDNIYGF